jgi:hypothetical protein
MNEQFSLNKYFKITGKYTKDCITRGDSERPREHWMKKKLGNSHCCQVHVMQKKETKKGVLLGETSYSTSLFILNLLNIISILRIVATLESPKDIGFFHTPFVVLYTMSRYLCKPTALITSHNYVHTDQHVSVLDILQLGHIY